ncbi:DNA repair protein RecO [Succinispira mobilis]|uniref:DNA repair protein RecO n=1 Tax=Succinispira mobilis TaxID=78120 RepID=UPI000374A7AE|nr:DNA repair protein RecO [Succinispira mobilis]
MSLQPFNTQLIILKVKQTQATDKLLVCYSREHGKLLVMAYGVARAKNMYNALLQPFNNLEMLLFPNKKIYTFKQGELIGPRLPDADFEFLTYASILTELVEEFTVEGQADEPIYDLLTQCLQLLTVRNKRLVTIIFSIKLLGYVGLAPLYNNCIACNKTLTEDAYFSALKGGAVCEACKVTEELPFDYETQVLMEKFTKLDLSTKIEFSIKGKQLLQLEYVIQQLFYLHLDKPLKSLQFLSKLH